MLKIYNLIFIAIFVLAGCTNNNPSVSNPNSDSQTLVAQGDGNFGVVEFNKTEVKSFTFKNDSSSTISLTPEIIGGNFGLLSLGCQTVEKNRSCLVKVVFDSNKESGVYSSQLKVGSLTIPLSAEIATVPSVAYQFFIDGVESNGSLGVLSGNNLKLMNVKVKNNSPKIGSVSSLVSSNSKYNIINTTCSNVILKPNQSCYAKLVVKGDNSGTTLATNLTFDNQGPSLSLTQEIENLAGDLQPLNSSITLGDVYKEGENRIQILTIENQGKSAGTISDITVPPGFNVISNNCLNVKPGYKCIIRVVYSTTDIPKGQYTNQIDLGDDASVQVTVNQVTNPNKLDKVELVVDSDILVNTCAPISVTLKDVDGLDYITSQVGTLTSNEPLYQDSNCSVVNNSLAAFEPAKTFYFKKTVAGLINLQVSYNSKMAQKNVNFYDSLTASVAPIIITNQATQVLVQGGKEPYQYSVTTGSGTVSAAGIFQSSTDGDMIIKVEDSLNLSTTVSIKVVNPLQLVAQKATQVVSSSQNFSVTGGLAPFTYSVTGGGSINPSTGVYTASSSSGSVLVKVVDSSNQSSQLTITVVPVLSISPLTDKIITNQNKTFVGSGGVLPYSFSVTGVGSINSSTGVYSAGVVTGNSVVKITDAIGQEAISNVIVVSPLTLSAQPNQIVNAQQTITAAGGLAPYNYTLVTGLGSVNLTSGVFTSGLSSGPVTLRVTDNSSQSADVTVNVVSVLTISPATVSLIVAGSNTFTGVGGLAPYSYSITVGGGTINSTTGLFTASNTAGSVTVRVTDSLNQTADANISVAANIAIGPGNCSFDIPESMNCTVTSSGGIGSRTYSTNRGTINSTTGVFKGQCVNNLGSSVVTVTDQYGNSAQTTLSYPCVYQSCNQIKADVSGAVSGVYWVDLDGLSSGNDPFQVYCNQTLAQGGWTLVTNAATTSAAVATTASSAIASGGLPNFSSNYNLYQLFPTFNTTNKMITINGTTQIPGVLIPTPASSRWVSDTVGTAPAYYPYIDFITSPTYIYGFGFSQTQVGQPNVGISSWCSGTEGLYLYLNADAGAHKGVSSWQAGCNSGAYWKTNFSWQMYDKMLYHKHPNSCLDAKNKGTLNSIGTTATGTFTIDPDGYGQGVAPFDVICDQETEGGGWTVIIDINRTGSATVTRDYLAKFGSTTNINSTIYQDSKGFGWGTNDQNYKAFQIANVKDYTTMKITITGAYNTPAGGLGSMSVGSASYQGYYWNQTLPGSTRLNFSDGNTDVLRQGLSYTDATGSYSESVFDVTNRTLNLVGGYNNLNWINMTGYSSGYAYTKRYISLLMVR